MTDTRVHTDGPDDLSGESNTPDDRGNERAQDGHGEQPAPAAGDDAPRSPAPAKPAEDPAPAAGDGGEDGGEDGPPEAPQSVDGLPDWAQQHIAALRRENASQRERRKEAETRADTAVARAEKATADYRAKLDLLVERQIDPKFLSMISGDTPEQWTAAADSLAELRGGAPADPVPPRVDPAQAADPSPTDLREQAASQFFASLSQS